MINEKELRDEIIQSFEIQGFKFNPHVRPPDENKETYKRLQQYSKIEQLKLQKKFLSANLSRVEKYIRNGKEINPKEIKLELRLVKPHSLEEKFFRWWNLIWWSMPYQRGYGRMLRFVIWDVTHNAPFGLICLQSPVLKLSVRDQYLQLPLEELDTWINQSMQAQRLGALPPYNDLLGGKMVALSITCNEIRETYTEKYKDVKTLIKNRKLKNRLLFLSTTSAYGKSSIYNRLKYKDELVALPIGYTKGAGSFHVPEHLYLKILKFLKEKGYNVARHYGNGPSRKMRLISTGLNLLNLKNSVYHNIKREFYLFPLASNLQFIIKENAEPSYYDRSFNELCCYWIKRWAVPRAERNKTWLNFSAKKFIKNTVTTYQL